MPINWGLSYKIIGFEFQYIAKLFTSLFPLLLYFSFLDLYIKTKKISFLLTIPLLHFIFSKILSGLLYSGYMDLPVAVVGWISLSKFIESFMDKSKDAKEVYFNVMLGCIFAVVAALIKQAGLYLLIISPFLSFFIIKRHFSAVESIKKIGILFLFLSAIIVPWYLFKEFDISRGRDVSNVSNLISYSRKGKDVLETLFYAVSNLISVFSVNKYFPACLLLSLVFSFRNFRQSWPAFIIGVPYVGIWASSFSYDLRNVSFAIPSVALGLVIGVSSVVEMFHGLVTSKKWVQNILYIFVIGAIFYCNQFFTGKDLARFQEKEIFSTVGQPGVNNLLIQYEEKSQDMNIVITNYQPVAFMKAFKFKTVIVPSGDSEDFISVFQNYENPYVLLLPGGTIHQHLQNQERELRAEMIFESNGYVLYHLLSLNPSIR